MGLPLVWPGQIPALPAAVAEGEGGGEGTGHILPTAGVALWGLTVDRGCCCPGGGSGPLLLLSCPVFMETDTSGGFGSPGEVWATSSSFPGPAGVAELDVLGEEEGMCVCGCGVGGCLGMRKEFLCVILCCLL